MSHSPPPPRRRCWRKSPGRSRVRRAAPACQWQPRILEEVGSCPEYFSYGAPPLESEAAVFSLRLERDGGVWGSCQKREGSLFFPRVEEGAAFFHLLQFPNQTHPRQPKEERPKGETRALGWCSRRRRARDAGGVRAAGRKDRVSGLSSPHEGRVTAASQARSEAARPGRSVPASLPGSAEVRRAGAGNKGDEWGGERVGRRRAPGRLPEDPGRRKPKCHLNSTQGASAWDPSALISNNG